MWLPHPKFTQLLDSIIHIFAVSMKTTGAILLKILEWDCLENGPQFKVERK